MSHRPSAAAVLAIHAVVAAGLVPLSGCGGCGGRPPAAGPASGSASPGAERVFTEHGPRREFQHTNIMGGFTGKARRVTTDEGVSLSIRFEVGPGGWDMSESEARAIVDFVKKHRTTAPPDLPEDVCDESFVSLVGETTMVERSLGRTDWRWMRNDIPLANAVDADALIDKLETLLADLDRLAAARRPAVP